MSIWYAIWDALPFEMLHWDFMKNALLALLLAVLLLGVFRAGYIPSGFIYTQF